MYIYIYTLNTYLKYVHTRADTGGGTRGLSPPWAISGGGLSPPWELSPAWAIQGGDSQNVPPLSDSGGGQRFFSWYFLVNSFNKWCKIFGECNFRGGTVPPLSPPWGAQGGDKKFFGRFAPDLSPPWAKSCIRPCIYIYPYVCRMDVLYALLSLQI